MRLYMTAVIVILSFLSIASVKAQDHLRIGISQFPYTMHPGIDSMMAKNYVLGFVYQPLTVFNPQWQRICLLCEQLPSLDNGLATPITLADGTPSIRAEYSIRDDAYWGDGTPVTTQDVLFSLDVGRHVAVGIANYELYSKTIVAIEALDDKRFAVTYDKVSCDFNDITDFAVLPAHLEEPIFRANPDTYKTDSLYNSNPSLPGLYNGPYIISKRDSGSGFTLTTNPYWQGETPRIPTITIKTVENTTALSAQLLSGDIDMIAGELGLNADQAISLEKKLARKRNNDIRFETKPGLIYEHIELNLDNPALANPRIRKALLMAIDRETMIDTLFGGKQKIAHSNIHPLDSVYAPDPMQTLYDPVQANAILDDEGCVAVQPNSYRTCPDGTALAFSFRTTAGNLSRERVQQLIQAQWAAIGVQATIKNETPRILFSETTQKRQFDGALMFAWLSAPRNIPKTTLHSSMVPTQENGWSGQNFIGHRNAHIDTLLDRLETVCEPDANQALWNELQDYYTQNLPSLPLYFRAETHFLPDTLKGITPTGHQFPSSLWSQNWFFAEN